MAALIRNLDRRIFQPMVGVINPKGALRHDIPRDIPVYCFRAHKTRYALPEIIRLCWSFRPAALVTTIGHLNVCTLVGKHIFPREMRVLVREANTPSERLRFSQHPRAYQFLYRHIYPLADVVICNSEHVQKDLVARFRIPAEKTVIILNPVDQTWIRARATLASSPYHNDIVNLVAVGRLTFQKGFDLLLRSMRHVASHLSNVHLTIVGDGPDGRLLRGMAEHFGLQRRVSFAGYQVNPYPFIAHADLLVSSSRWEGSPNVILEAFACRTPVLAFNCPGGTREIVQPGINGWLIPVGDTKALGEKILELVERQAWLTFHTNHFVPEGHRCSRVVREFERVVLNCTS